MDDRRGLAGGDRVQQDDGAAVRTHDDAARRRRADLTLGAEDVEIDRDPVR
jgi:hypothetical protein